jgi:hypothetical protein
MLKLEKWNTDDTDWMGSNGFYFAPTGYVTAIKLSIVGAGRARDGRAATLYDCTQMSRARPAPTVSPSTRQNVEYIKVRCSASHIAFPRSALVFIHKSEGVCHSGRDNIMQRRACGARPCSQYAHGTPKVIVAAFRRRVGVVSNGKRNAWEDAVRGR